MSATHKAYLSLGSNIGERQQLIDEAVEQLGGIGIVVRRSSVVETEPVGFSSPNKFLNACVCLLTECSPRQLLETTQAIERRLGRTTKSIGGIYHDRPIDIDILLYDDVDIAEKDLVIPHPKMYEREFVMRPLYEIME